ncbi:MAG TPA: DUF92 domain-containing protein [Ktedonosporobacter sp.]|jgi:uncharacterized protein (TIGR00297 family)|nr:DUF92 domain-containing protein [Ktedonosporobacter sp.]
MSTLPAIPLLHESGGKQAKHALAKSRVQLLLGLFLSTGIGLLAYRRRSLSRSGVAGAVVTGTTTFGLGGWAWGLSLIFFFVSSSLFSHFRARDKAAIAADKFSKGSRRDIGQVAANGGMATLLALGYGATPSPVTRELLQAGYAGVIATATADTWATELGVLSPHPPRLITTGALTTPGTSGGITSLGTGAAILGALASGLFFWILRGCRRSLLALPLIALISGTIGNLFDSFLGATTQAMFYCPACDQETERQIHNCGARTRSLRGLPWMTNDMVNFLSTLVGGLAAMLLQLPFLRSKHPPDFV